MRIDHGVYPFRIGYFSRVNMANVSMASLPGNNTCPSACTNVHGCRLATFEAVLDFVFDDDGDDEDDDTEECDNIS